MQRSLRQVIVSGGPGETELSWVREGATALDLSLGLRRPTAAAAESRATFELLAAAPDGLQELLSVRLALVPGALETPWQEHRISLESLGEGSTNLIFRMRSEDPSLVALWGSPRLHVQDRKASWPPVILISIDTLGTRRMSLYGYPQATTPQLERLAQDAVVFDQAITHQSWTLTAHASLLTSLYPDSHRVSHGSALAASDPLLPALLREVGYTSFGLVNNPYLDPRFGYDRGYDIYDYDHELTDATGQRVKRSIEQSNVILEEWIERGLPKPWFLFYHVIDPHSDWRDIFYESPGTFRHRFVSPAEAETLPKPEGSASAYLAAFNLQKTELTLEQAQVIAAEYDASVAYTDHHLGEFLDLLRRHDLYDSAVIVVTSDHGEEFLEHGRMMHSQGYDECLRVPLLIKLPQSKYAGTRVTTQVQQIDLLPTLLSLLRLPVPEGAEGHSLLPVITGQPHPQPLAIAKGANYSMRHNDVYVARSEAWKLIWWRGTKRVELYDLKADPLEQNDLSAERPRQREALLDQLKSHQSKRDRGYKLRVPPYEEGPALEIRLTTDGRWVRALPYDQNRDFRLHLDRKDDHTLVLTFAAPDDNWRRAVGLNFDLSPEATEVSLEAFAGGEPLEPSQWVLGAKGEPAPALPLRLQPGSPAVFTTTEARIERQAPRPKIYLWETRPVASAEVKHSQGDLEALRALGYLP